MKKLLYKELPLPGYLYITTFIIFKHKKTAELTAVVYINSNRELWSYHSYILPSNHITKHPPVGECF